MKLLPSLLIGSLAANAALLVPLLRHSSATTTARPAAASISGPSAAGTSTTRSTRAGASASTASDRPAADTLQHLDLESLRDQLRASGLPDDVIRMVIGSSLWKKNEARFKALQASDDADKAWWKQQNGRWWGRQSKEQREEMKALQAEMKSESERLLGPDPDAAKNMNPWMARQYSFLPEPKREALQKLEQDYNELSGELQEETQGFQTPADTEKARFLEQEKRRDLAALLSPEEMRDYDLRQSPTAQQLRWRMTQMDATEQEYTAVFDLQKQFDDTFKNNDPFGGGGPKSPDDWKLRKEAEKALRAQIKATLGDERYQVYQLSQSPEFQQLQAAIKRYNLPPETTSRALSLRREIPAAAVKIADDTTLDEDAQRAALTRLAATAREKLRSTLGANVADTYLANVGMNWINQLESGTIVTFNDDGGETRRQISSTPSKKKNP